MASIEELMQYGTKRKVEGIGTEMGYPKGTVDYPNEVLEEVKRRHGKKTYSSTAQTAAEQEAENTAEEDLRSVERISESRSAGMLVALDALTMHHCATRKFRDPNLQKAVDESQARLRDFLGGAVNVYDPEAFLAQTPLAQLRPGENGSMRSLPPSSSASNEPNTHFSRKPSDKSEKPKDNGKPQS